jgi:hypothetical protein
VAFVDCALSDATLEFQDSNRLLCCELALSPEQVQFAAQASALAFTGAGRLREQQLELWRTWFQKVWKDRDWSAVVEFDAGVVQLVPKTALGHLARRITQVMRVAAMIVLLRWGMSRQVAAGSGVSIPVAGTMEDVKEALGLIREAGVHDDYPTIDAKSLAFLSLLDQILLRDEEFPDSEITVGALQEELNKQFAADIHRVAVESKRHHQGLALAQPWTRRIIDRHLHALFENGSVNYRLVGGLRRWFVTNAGRNYVQSGGTNLFLAIRGCLDRLEPGGAINPA